MLKIHRKIKYALLALKHISHKPQDELATAKEICSRFDIPFDPTSRVLQIMTQNGVLKAEQGAHGGYRLTRDLSMLTLFDLSHMVIGIFAITDCCQRPAECDRIAFCDLRGPMGNLNNRLQEVFKEIKVIEMITDHE